MFIDVSQQSGQKRLLYILAASYSLFIIYGSLMPLEFRDFSLNEIVKVVSHVSIYQFNIGSRSDLAANILLYIPFSFIWLAVLEYHHSRTKIWWSRFWIWVLCLGISIVIEISQIFLPERSFDIRDFISNAAGAAIGIAIWHMRGIEIINRLLRFQRYSGLSSVARQVLVFYLTILAVYQVMPLDLTLSPVEIYKDIKNGGLIFIPFTAESTDWLSNIHDFSVEFFIWSVVGVVWLFSSAKPALVLWARTIVFATILEMLQLLVHSRVADVTDIMSAITGSGFGIRFGVALIRRYPVIASHEHYSYRRAWVLIGMGAFLFWFLIIIWYYWFPFNFNFSSDYLSKRAADLPKLPFWSHFSSNEFNALADMLRIILFYAPLGSLLGFVAACLDKRRYRRYAVELATVVVLVCAVIVEFGQFFLPSRYPDLTDVAFGVGSALAGYWVIFTLQSRYLQHAHDEVAKAKAGPDNSTSEI